MALVSPSVGAFNVARLGEALEIIRDAGARMVHIDVSDGHFVPEVAFGVPVVASIRKATSLVLDLHLLIERPERFVADFVENGAGRIAIHPESTLDLYRTLRLIRSRGALAGAALLPGTPVERIGAVLRELDFLTILSTEPGAAEDIYIPNSTSKLRAAFDLRARQGAEYSLQVEGGVDLHRLKEVIDAGADVVVAGAAWLREPDLQTNLKELIRLASGRSENSERAESYFREL